MEIKCPGCGAALVFDAQTGKMQCKYCGSFFTMPDIEDQHQRVKLTAILIFLLTSLVSVPVGIYLCLGMSSEAGSFFKILTGFIFALLAMCSVGLKKLEKLQKSETLTASQGMNRYAACFSFMITLIIMCNSNDMGDSKGSFAEFSEASLHMISQKDGVNSEQWDK